MYGSLKTIFKGKKKPQPSKLLMKLLNPTPTKKNVI